MSKRKEPETSPKDQYERFKEAARELECDDDEGRFKERFKRLTDAPPPEKAQKQKVDSGKPSKG